MDRQRDVRLRLELLESRLVPAVVRTMGTIEITDNQASPNRTFASKYTDYNWTVPENDNLVATQAVTYSFTKDELAAVRSNAGLTLTENIWWRERDLFDDNTIKRTKTTYKFTADGTTVIYAPQNFNTTNGENTDIGSEGSTAEYYGWLDKPNNIHNYTTDELWLTNGGLGGGAVRNARTATEGTGYALNLQFADPTLPTLAGGATNYRLMTFDSADGTDFTVTAANASGYSLFSASSADLVYDSGADDVTFDPNTSFVPVYSDGSGAAGIYAGAGPAWTIQRTSDGKMFYLTGYTYTQVPPALAGLADGQSTTVSGGSLQAGSGALWLTYETDGESVGFLIVGGDSGSGGSGGTVQGTLWNDANDDGIQNDFAGGLAGQPVYLLDGAGNQLDQTTTDESGGYAFYGLGAGTYRIGFVAPAGYVLSPKDQGTDDAVDSDADPTTGQTDTFTVSVGGTIEYLDAGAYTDSSGGSGGGTIQGLVWNDADDDGIQNDFAGGLAGQPVYLLDGSGNQLDQTTTDEYGDYAFYGLGAGTYRIEFVAPAGYAFSPPAQGTDDTVDSDADPATGQTGTFTVSVDGTTEYLDAGAYTDSSGGSGG